MSATKAINPDTFIHYETLSYHPLTGENLSEKLCLESDIVKLVENLQISREKAIYALSKCVEVFDKREDIYERAKMWCFNLKYELKFPPPEKGIKSIFGIQSMTESKIWSENGRPVYLSKTASLHYGVERLEDMINKSVLVFRRFQDEKGGYEIPYKYYNQKAKIVGIKYTFCLNMATIEIETEFGLSLIHISEPTRRS